MDSILNSIKKMLGIDPSYTHFDADLIMHINSALVLLSQLGVGEKPFMITSEVDSWSDFLDDRIDIELVKTYVQMNVRLMFDPPLNSSVTEVIKEMISKLEWHINSIADKIPEEETTNVDEY